MLFSLFKVTYHYHAFYTVGKTVLLSFDSYNEALKIVEASRQTNSVKLLRKDVSIACSINLFSRSVSVQGDWLLFAAFCDLYISYFIFHISFV